MQKNPKVKATEMAMFLKEAFEKGDHDNVIIYLRQAEPMEIAYITVRMIELMDTYHKGVFMKLLGGEL